MTTGSTSVVIVNHNTRELLCRCLLSVLPEKPAQTVVVDTDSRDGSADLVRDRFPGIELLTVENRGYGAAANAGIARTDALYVFLLNADTRVEPGALEALARYLNENPVVAVVGPEIVDESGRRGRTGRRFPTPLEVLLQESGLHRLKSHRRQSACRRVDWVLGAALALRLNAFGETGGFDESYSMYNEEVDLCLRFERAGWEVHYAPVATVCHVGGASTSPRRPVMAAEYVRSTLLLYRRHFSHYDEVQLKIIFATALTARLVRDRLRLLLTTDRGRRRELESEIDAWESARAALRSARRRSPARS